jgi:hypothetical protein
MSEFFLPDNSQHILLIGKNGSGKTRAAVWHLSKKDFQNEIWIVVNHKREKLINSIPGAQFLGLAERPKKPGVYIYMPRPDFDDEEVTGLLWWVYEHENVGVYIDEGYMIAPRDPALNALYTQGRSKHTPVITLSQRPSKISRFAVSEAAFYQVFHLVDRRDRKIIQEFIPPFRNGFSLEELMVPEPGRDRRLKPYHSVYYDTSGDEPLIMAPVPSDEEILAVFAEKLVPPEQLENTVAKFNKL